MMASDVSCTTLLACRMLGGAAVVTSMRVLLDVAGLARRQHGSDRRLLITLDRQDSSAVC